MRARVLLVTVAVWVVVAALALWGPSPAGAARDRIIVAQGGDVTTLDPHMHAENYAFVILQHIYEKLFTRTIKDGKLFLEPVLAESYKLLNPTTWEFKLRRGVTFHHGEPFTAAAVKYSIERMLNPEQKARYRGLVVVVDRVEVVDDYTVRIYTKEPFPILRLNLAYAVSIVPPKYFQEKGDKYVAQHPSGTGPYRFVRWVKDDELVLKAYPGYWRPGIPRVPNLIFKPIPEEASRVATLLAGDVDVIRDVSPTSVPRLRESETVEPRIVPTGMVVHFALDTLSPGPLKDARVRRALNLAVNKQLIIKQVLGGFATQVPGPITQFHFGFDPSVPAFDYNPDEARRLLAEAGYPQGFSMTINAPTGRYLNDKEVAQAVAYMLGQVGVKVNLVTHEWAGYMGKIYRKELGTYMMGWGGSLDADGTMYNLLYSTQVFARIKNERLDQLLMQGKAVMDPKEREKTYAEAQRIVHEQAPWIFLYAQNDIFAAKRDLVWQPQGAHPTLSLRFWEAYWK